MKTCKKCGMTLNNIEKCCACGNDDQNIITEPPVQRRSRMLIVWLCIAVAFSILTVIISLATIFYSPELSEFAVTPNSDSILLKIFAWITLSFAALNLATAAFVPRLKKWTIQIYIAFIFLNFIASFTVFTVSNFISGIAL